MFVACDMMEYYPYKSLFTRILGNDNIFKSLSTFAVEMTELRTILKLADENSLILGDELCSSTETGSAISIFVAGLMKLYESKSSFIFALDSAVLPNCSEDSASAFFTVAGGVPPYSYLWNNGVTDEDLIDV